MIKLKKRPPEPRTLRSRKVATLKRTIEELVRINGNVTSRNFTTYWLKDDIRETLWEHQEHKCCYCERIRDLKRESDVEHYRPKAGITEDPGHPGYWWLAYEWTNYLYACKACNEHYKKNHFPLLPNGSRARRPADNLAKEKPAILNPFDDDPGECIGFNWIDSDDRLVKPTGEDSEGRGEVTIRLIGLNSSQLAEERGELLLLLQGIAVQMHTGQYCGNLHLIETAKKAIERETNSDQRFAGFRRAFFRKHGLSQYISND